MPPAVPRVTLICKHCRSTFERMECERTGGRSQFCSRACYAAAREKRRQLTCPRCQTEFSRKVSEVPGPGPYFCSVGCYKVARAARATSYPKIGERHAHRIVAERMLGRPLQPGEVVHHKDENKRNFAANNLAILPSRVEHTRLHSTGTVKGPETRAKIAEGVRRARRSSLKA